MRGATQCAQRLKKQLSAWRNKAGKVTPATVSDPITQLILGVLSRNAPESKARQLLDQLREQVVDYNELRVIPAHELIEMLGDISDVHTKAEDILRALNYIFAREFEVSLDRLREVNKKEAIAYIDEIEGLEAYTRARIRLLGLELHAIPMDEAMWAYARQVEVIDPKCSLEEAQSFLERQISTDEALEFVALLEKQSWSECGAGVRAGKFERVVSVPPERVTTHMLADVSPDLTPLGTVATQPVEVAASKEAEEQAKASKSKSSKKSTKKEAETESESKTKSKSAEKTTKTTKATKAKKAAKSTTKTAAKKTAAKKTSTKKTAAKATKSVAKKAKTASKSAKAATKKSTRKTASAKKTKRAKSA